MNYKTFLKFSKIQSRCHRPVLQIAERNWSTYDFI